jgi:hypothetical protein
MRNQRKLERRNDFDLSVEWWRGKLFELTLDVVEFFVIIVAKVMVVVVNCIHVLMYQYLALIDLMIDQSKEH